MRVSANTVRLAGLVAAATASGYLWRVALEPGHTTPTIIRVAPATIPEIPLSSEPHAPTSRPVTANRPGARPQTALRHRSPRVEHVVSHVAAPAPHTFTSDAVASRPVATPKPKPKPAPKPAPAPAPPPVAAPTPSAQPAASAPSSPPAPAATTPTDASESSKPGWGNGDKNHDHGGPPGDKHG